MRLKKAPTLVYLFFLIVLITLGIWQLGRAEIKRTFLEKKAQVIASQDVMEMSNIYYDNVDAIKYKKVKITGHYDPVHQFLVDNRISAGKVGYFVLTPFILEGEAKVVLVNRGWIPLNPDRSDLPDIQIKSQQFEIIGRINSFPSVGIKLIGAEIPTNTWPSVVQVIDSQILANKLGYFVFPYQVELDSHLPEGYKREWQAIKIMQPEQHMAYAIQWFALAFTLTMLFLWYSLKK